MTLTKNFLHKEPDFIKISRFKVIIGILVGLFFAFAFYSFLYLIREVFRILSVTETYDLWILTDNEVNFYNLIFAFISVIIGQSVTFSFWFDRPKSIFGKQNYRKTTIINDQRALNWYFLSWFSKLAIVFGLMFGLTFSGGFYVFSFYQDYNYIFILIVIVLFLQTWNTISLTFKRKGQKWMLISGALLSITVFGFSRINLIDYKTINQNYLQKNIHYSYNLELPETDSYERLFRRSLIENIYIVETKTQQANNEPVIIVDNEKIAIEILHEKIVDWQSMRNEYDIPRMVYRLHIHKSIKMDFVNQVKNELTKSGVSKIAYAVIPTNHEYDKKYYQDCSFSMILPNLNADWLNPKAIYRDLNKIQNIIEIKQTESDYLINDSLLKTNRIKDTIKSLIQKNSDCIIKFHVNDNAYFSDYFRVLSATKEAINELRDEYSEKKYFKKYDLLDNDEESEVRQKFPFRIFEITTDLKKRIENE
jgi:biopolymer transport protein ExbD